MMGLQAPHDARTKIDGTIVMMEEDSERKSAKLYRPIVSLQRVWKTYVKGVDDVQPSGSLSSSDGDSALSSYIPSISFTPVDSGQDPDSEDDDRMNTRSSASPTGRISPKLESHLLPASGHLGVDSENESVVSDYSEMADPVKEHLANVHIACCPNLDSTSPTRFVVYEKVLRGKGEGEEEFFWRLRKTNFLSLAQEFADLKRCNEEALPFNLHERRYRDVEESESDLEEISGDSCGLVDISLSMDHSEGDCDSGWQDDALFQPAECQDSGNFLLGGKSELECPTLVDANNLLNFKPNDVTNFDELLGRGFDELTRSETTSVPISEGSEKSMQKFSVEKFPDVPDQPSILPSGTLDNVDPLFCAGEAETGSEQKNRSNIVFQRLKIVEDLEDCSIEKVFPQWDWKRLEDELTQTCDAEREKNLQSENRSDREEILQRLAMLDEEEEEEWYNSRESELSRMTNPLSMDICYVNEAADDQDLDPDEWDSYDDDSRPDVVPFDHNSEAVDVDELNVHSSSNDLLAKQATLEAEARMALAQVRPMAQLQSKSDVEKQEKRLMTEMIGSSASSEDKISRHIGQRTFERMTFAQLQIFVNDLHSQIEVLNLDLMLNLVERDDLHMIQDSMLVDIEDLTGRAREYAAKVDHSQEEKLSVQKHA